VSVNGSVVRTPDHWVDLDRDRVALDGHIVQEQHKRYVLLYKPAGYLTTYRDPEGRPTVYDLVEPIADWLAPVGRLDQDTSGLLLLTNDTQFANRIMDPRFHVPKTYLVKTAGILEDAAIEKLRSGVLLSDGPTRPAAVTWLRNSASSTFLEITLTEGRNRQVRRMIEAVGSKVRKLVRTALGPLRIGDLSIGRWRELTPSELRSLKVAAGWPPERDARVVPPSPRDGKPGKVSAGWKGRKRPRPRRPE
jgi:pseudouridine synthase